MRGRNAARRSLALSVIGASTLVVLMMTAAPAFAPVGLPAITGLDSQTHPDPAKWYSNSYPAFLWTPSVNKDVAGYSVWFDTHPTTDPDSTTDRLKLRFAPNTDWTSGDGPDAIAVGDFNDDGKADMVVANEIAKTVAVLLGDGSGGFAKTATDPTTGDSPRGVAVGDFNGDSKADLAVAAYMSSQVNVLIGNGDGTFAAKVDYVTGDGPQAVAVGDFNGDGKADLAVANRWGNTVSILLNDGDGTFTKVATDLVPNPAPGATPRPNWVAVGDVNGDGKQDLAVANSEDDTVAVFLGDGAGGFAKTATNPATGWAPRSVAVGDFNGDGMQDLVTANADSGTVGIYLGDGAGGFTKTATDSATGANPYSVTVADFNSDGIQDLATANTTDSTVSVLLGVGDGTFPDRTDMAAGAGTWAIDSGDFNADGRPDLATADYTADDASVLINLTLDAVAAYGPRGDGVWYFHICAVDGLGGQGPTSHLAVNIDTIGPTTRALAAASVRRGRSAKLRYQADDARPGSPTATVVIKIRNSHNKVVKTLKVGVKNVNTALAAKFTCKLATGKYRFFVYATEQAGNMQSAVGSNKLTVK